MNLSSKILTDILTQLVSGERNRVVIKFDSDSDREIFRVAIYKQKRVLDEILLMTDATYKQLSLRFDKISGGVILTLFKPTKVSFEIIEDH